MNRGNLPRVFGELYFLLEYRNEAVRLMYSPDEEFRLPKQLLVIGAMNTADRSVAILDQALRRRFHFVPMYPGEEPVRSMLRAFLAHRHPSLQWLAALLECANLKLDRNLQIGPSHFMREQLDEETARRIWRFGVLPSIAEQYFGREDELATLDFDVLRAAI
jgi:5-methylcytosine-specific restriction protein B